MWNTRSSQSEIIDLGPPHYTEEEYNDCLTKLDRVGRWLGGDQATFAALDFSQTPLSILDVGCGGGSFTIRLAQRYPQAQVMGIDINPLAINYAKRKLSSMLHPPRHITFECRPQEKLEEAKKSYDIVLSTLVCHHLSDEDLIDFVTRAVKVAKKKVIFNDLHRHPMAYYLFKTIAPIMFKNRLIQHDGPISILRSFTYQDWIYYLEKARIPPSSYSIQWRYAFRWLVEINTEESAS